MGGLQSTRLLHPWDFPGKSAGFWLKLDNAEMNTEIQKLRSNGVQKRVCARVRVCKRGQTEGAAVQGGEDAPGKGSVVKNMLPVLEMQV